MSQKKNRAVVTLLYENTPEIIKAYFYTNVLSEPKLQEVLKKEMGIPDENEIFSTEDPLSELISFYIDTIVISQDKASDAFIKVKEKKRQFKKNIFKKIREEQGEFKISARNPHFLDEDCSTFSFLKTTQSGKQALNFDTVEEYRSYKYNLVKNWNSDSEKLALEFEYYGGLKKDMMARGFLIDLEYYICDYICTELHDDISEGFLTKLPEEILDAPFFNYRRTNMDLEIEVDEKQGNVNVVENYEQGSVKIKTTLRRENIENRTAVAVIEELKKNYVMSKAFKNLDTDDMAVLANICSFITGDNILDGSLTFTLKDLYPLYYGKDRRMRNRDYKALLLKVDKLAKYNLDLFRYDKEMKAVEYKILHFYDASYLMPINDETSDLQEYDIQDIDKLLETVDISKSVINISLGNTIKEAWKQNRVMKVCSRIYDALDNSKERALLFILEEKRINSYPELEARISINEISNKIRFSKDEKMKKIITSMLDSFVEKKFIVESYNFSISNILIHFLPMSSFEMDAYELTPVSPGAIGSKA